MQTDRVAQVFVGEDGRGSGYLVAPTLVLTAAHVIGTGGAGIAIRTIAALRNGDRSRVTARLLVRDDDRDLALLEIPASQKFASARFGALGGKLPIPVETIGFPDATLRDGKSDTLAVTGECHTTTGCCTAGASPFPNAMWPNTSVFAAMGVAAVVARGSVHANSILDGM